jgi:hypothetical protein
MRSRYPAFRQQCLNGRTGIRAAGFKTDAAVSRQGDSALWIDTHPCDCNPQTVIRKAGASKFYQTDRCSISVVELVSRLQLIWSSTIHLAVGFLCAFFNRTNQYSRGRKNRLITRAAHTGLTGLLPFE